MSDTSVAGRYLGDAGIANGYEQPVNWGRMFVMVAAALPALEASGGRAFMLFTSLRAMREKWARRAFADNAGRSRLGGVAASPADRQI